MRSSGASIQPGRLPLKPKSVPAPKGKGAGAGAEGEEKKSSFDPWTALKDAVDSAVRRTPFGRGKSCDDIIVVEPERQDRSRSPVRATAQPMRRPNVDDGGDSDSGTWELGTQDSPSPRPRKSGQLGRSGRSGISTDPVVHDNEPAGHGKTPAM